MLGTSEKNFIKSDPVVPQQKLFKKVDDQHNDGQWTSE